MSSLRRHDPTNRSGWAVDLLLPALPAWLIEKTATEDYQPGAMSGAAWGFELAYSFQLARSCQPLRRWLPAGSLQLHLIHNFQQRPLDVPGLRNRQHLGMIERLAGDRPDGNASSAIAGRVLQHLEK